MIVPEPDILKEPPVPITRAFVFVPAVTPEKGTETAAPVAAMVTVSDPAEVVIFISAPSAKVRVSLLPSATIVDCPDTATFLKIFCELPREVLAMVKSGEVPETEMPLPAVKFTSIFPVTVAAPVLDMVIVFLDLSPVMVMLLPSVSLISPASLMSQRETFPIGPRTVFTTRLKIESSLVEAQYLGSGTSLRNRAVRIRLVDEQREGDHQKEERKG